MRKDLLTLALAPLLLVSCSCSHREAPAGTPDASTNPNTSARAPLPVLSSTASSATPTDASPGTPAAPDQVLRITLLDERSRDPVYHAGLNLAGSKSLQWTDRQGRHEWTDGGFAATGSIEIRCPAVRAETGRKLKAVAYDMKEQLTDVSATIDGSACVEPPEKTSAGDYAGTYFPYYGHGAFLPCAGLPADASFYGNAKGAWVNFGDAANGQFAKLREAASIDPASDQPIHVEWSGSLTGPGAYGGQGAFAYKADVTEVKKVSTDFPSDCPAGNLQ